MTRRDPSVPLRHMLDYAREASEFTTNRTKHEIESDRTQYLALTRLIEIVGEAANRVAPELKAQNPDVQWSDIIAMGNRLIHAYDLVDFDAIWDTVTNDLVPLIAALERMVAETP